MSSIPSPSGEQSRVLCFGRFADADFGGLERHVRALCQALRNDVFYVNLVAARDAAHDTADLCPTVRAATLGTLASTPLCPTMPVLAARLHQQYRFQIAHLHLPDPMSHLAALALPASVGIVITWHSDIVRQKRLLALYRPLQRRLLRRAGAIIAPTPMHFTSSRELAGLGLEAKFRVVPFGFDLARFAAPAAAAAALRTRLGTPMIFALGRHVYYKGFEYLIEAMRDVPRATLVLGGQGPLTGFLRERAAALGLASRVVFAGRIADEQLPAWYQACDVFCMPSVDPSEAFGIVQLEAMACGKPVVCCELGNGVTFVNRPDETGLAVAPRDPAALAAALNRVLGDDALRQRLGAAARERALTAFSLESLRAGTLAVYREVIAGARQAAS